MLMDVRTWPPQMALYPDQRMLLFIAALLWLICLSPLVDELLRLWNLHRPNFRGDTIPAAYGLFILLWSALVMAVLIGFLPKERPLLAVYLGVTVGLGALGFIDDRWGDREVKGLRGHLRRFFIDGVITTGFVKAAGGLAVAIVVPHLTLEQEGATALLNGLIIALCANAFNLLDLRPGRACAVFLFSAVVLLAAQMVVAGRLLVSPLLLVVIPTLYIYPRDARAQIMLGDTGSNLLGGALGLALTLAFPALAPRLGFLIALILLHLLAERYSLSRLIEQNALLRRLDALTGKR